MHISYIANKKTQSIGENEVWDYRYEKFTLSFCFALIKYAAMTPIFVHSVIIAYSVLGHNALASNIRILLKKIWLEVSAILLLDHPNMVIMTIKSRQQQQKHMQQHTEIVYAFAYAQTNQQQQLSLLQ